MTVNQEKTLPIQQAIDLAVQHHQAGELPKAEGIYQQILQANPNQLSFVVINSIIFKFGM